MSAVLSSGLGSTPVDKPAVAEPMRDVTYIEVPVAAIVFREDLYPRIEKSALTVQKYAADLEVLPPIEINQKNELIDGWNRWTAHKEKDAKTIRAFVTHTRNDAELFELAITRNAAHGLQLSQEDKQDAARSIYHATPERHRDEKKKQLAKILSVSERTIREWLSRIDKDAKAARDKRIFEMWMACYSMEEIAAAVDVHKDTISEICRKKEDLPESDKAAASHLTDFDLPLYNVWRQREKTPGSTHFGNSEVRWVDNLLYLYTRPFEIVVDPFAGGGSTIDVCRRRFRRCWAGDRRVKASRAHEIREHDLVVGGRMQLPRLPRWQDVKLVYLDPPYWRQAEGQYSDAATDLANMSLSDFTSALAMVITSFAKKLRSGSVIALMMQPTQWNAPERQYTDHVWEMARLVNLPVDMRFQCPYESEQYSPQMVEWAKANRKVLVLSRELVIWRIP
jgi:predicted DNA-binding protein YlxM (UPF0122 family)